MQVGREGLRDAGRRGLGEAGMEGGGGQAAGVQEGRSQGGAAGMGAGRGVGGLKAACQQKQAVRRHLFDQGSLPPYQLICRLLNTGAACYLNSAINLLFSSLQFNDTFSVIKSRGPLTNQLYLLCDSYPGQVRQLYLYLESRYLLPIDSQFDRQQSWLHSYSSCYNKGNFVLATQKWFYSAKLQNSFNIFFLKSQ